MIYNFLNNFSTISILPTLILMLISNIITVLFFFIVGFRFYVLLHNSSSRILITIKNKINFKNLEPWKIFLIAFFFYMIVWYLSEYILNTYFSTDIIDNSRIYMSSNNDQNNSSGGNTSISVSAGLSAASDATVFATGMGVGSHLMKSAPTMTGKIAAAAGSIGLGAAAVIAKKAASSLSLSFPGSGPESSSSKKIIGDSIWTEIDRFSNTDNVLDFLFILQIFNNLQKLFLIFLLYYLIIYTLNVEKFIQLISTTLKLSNNNKITNYAYRAVSYIKNSGLVLIYIFLILSICDVYLLSHYFNFLVDNFEQICEYHISYINKNK